MKQAVLIVLAVGLLVGGVQGVAFAQGYQGTGAPMAHNPSDDSQTGAMKPGWTPTGGQAGGLVNGTITELDFAKGTMTLDNGEQFTLAEHFEYTSLPMLGQAVAVTFAEQNGQKVVQQIDPNDTGKSSHSN